MEIIKLPNKKDWSSLLKRPVKNSEELEKAVIPLLEDIKKLGDIALRAYTQKFDKVSVESFLVTGEEIREAESLLSKELKMAINTAKRNIEFFHSKQKNEPEIVETMTGVTCWRKNVAIEKVGLYVPGGTAPLFSTVLMLAIPATIAGCKEIVLCTPPDTNEKIHPAILYTAHLCGVTKIYKAGGAQAIGAMAYGTETIPAVYKIFGPGNQFVTLAKQLVNKAGVAIDMPAGPSEVAIFANHTSNPAFVASDLLSQAEHGSDSQVILVSTNEDIIFKVEEELGKQLAVLPRMEFAKKALENSKFFLMSNENEAIDLLNEYAAEHLILAVDKPERLAEMVINAGSVFMGHFTPEAAGDYASGTNHTLPTNGYAKSYSGVSLDSFYKKITFQSISPQGLTALGPVIEIMAENELLQAHKNAVSIRLNEILKS